MTTDDVTVLSQPVTVHLFSYRTNKSLCGPVGLRPLPSDYQPAVETLPGVMAEETEQEVTSEEQEVYDDAYQSAEQLGVELVTLSLLPESRWKSLLHLDEIKVGQWGRGADTLLGTPVSMFFLISKGAGLTWRPSQSQGPLHGLMGWM